MKKFAVLLYPDFSLQEITCLTSALTVWFGERIDYIASENKEYRSEDGLGSSFMRDTPDEYTEENLTFYWSDQDYQEFLEELKAYTPAVLPPGAAK